VTVTDWSVDLASRLFAPPARWGWRAADLPVPAPPPPDLAPTARPVWVEPPHPDTSQLRRARAKAMRKLMWRLAIAGALVVAFAALAGQASESTTDDFGGTPDQSQSVSDAVPIVGLVGAGILLIVVLRAMSGVASASRAIAAFEQPYLAFRSAEQQRHQQALAQWDAAVHQHQAAVAQAEWHRSHGPLWYPVHPVSQPTRIDVVGGDPRRHGWASLVTTLGTSVLAGGLRLTLVDLTGQDVAGGLVAVAQARRMTARHVDLAGGGGGGGGGQPGVDLLAGLSPAEIAESLAYALSAPAETPSGDPRHERAFVIELVSRVLGALAGPPSLGRIAAGVDVLRQVTPAGQLAPEELSALADQVGDLGQDEWTTRQMRFVASQLRSLDEAAPAGLVPLLGPEQVTSIATGGGTDDRARLVDRVLAQLLLRVLRQPGRVQGCLVVAGADDLGAATLDALSDACLAAHVRLVLLIDHPQGDLEKHLGTGGAVCIMKMYNHRDAGVAADFIGREYRFVVSQVTYQVGKTFTDGGNDNFSVNTGASTNPRAGLFKPGGLSESRGQTWAGSRNWSTADNVSDSRGSTRVHEFVVEPAQILGMPETAFILVDNSGQGRQVVLADSNPGISLRDRVSPTPA
jgi:hypothetical protein